MPACLTIAALGVVMDLTFAGRTSEAFVDAVARAWSRCLADGAASDAVPACRRVEPLAVAAPADESEEALRAALQRLSRDVTLHLIAAQSGRLLMFHAGAVCHSETGESLVFVAPSGTGKTTLAGFLGRSYGYLTDETVGIDPATGGILAYPKPLSIAPASDRRKVETAPDALGLLAAHPLPMVARVALLDRRDTGGAAVRAEALPLLDAVSALIPETSALNRLERPLRTVAEVIDRTGPVVRLTYRDSADLASAIPGLLGPTG